MKMGKGGWSGRVSGGGVKRERAGWGKRVCRYYKRAGYY